MENKLKRYEHRFPGTYPSERNKDADCMKMLIGFFSPPFSSWNPKLRYLISDASSC